MKEAYTLKEIEEKIEHEKYLRKENQQLYEELQVLRKCSDTTNDLANEYKKELDKYKNIVDEIEKQINTLVEMNSKYDYEDTESLYSKKWLKEITDDLLKIIKGE